MKTATLLLLGATPGVAAAYLLLTAYLLTRIRPLPITRLPYSARPDAITQPSRPDAIPQPVRRDPVPQAA